jgi:hypothetical protein
MFYNDHSPPHFHAKYEDTQASIRINDVHVIDGNLGARALRLVEEWRILHRQSCSMTGLLRKHASLCLG